MESRYNDSINLDEQALALTREEVPPNDQRLAAVLVNTANTYSHLVRHEDALHAYTEAGEIYLQANPVNHKRVVEIQRAVAICKEKVSACFDVVFSACSPSSVPLFSRFIWSI